MFECYAIEDLLPKYIDDEAYFLENDNVIPEEYLNLNLEFSPLWVKHNVSIGNMGEIIAQMYLEKMYPRQTERISLEDSSRGFDIQVGKQYFEVKTSYTDSLSFNISYHELMTAKKYKINYNLFYIQCHKDSAKGIIIHDLFETLNLAQINTGTYHIEGVLSYKPQAFIITMDQQFCCTQKNIDLSNEVHIINKLLSS